MITVAMAEAMIRSQTRDYGTEHLPFASALGRVLATPLLADRDLPPYDRVTMDGIAISYSDWEQGLRSFRVLGLQAAGMPPLALEGPGACIEIMTGAVLPPTADTVIRYEDLVLSGDQARIVSVQVSKGQFIHRQGSDKQSGEVLVPAGALVQPAVIAIAAAIGQQDLTVYRWPKVLILSSGDELVDTGDLPGPFQIRRSNSYAMKAALAAYGLEAALLHLPDDPKRMQELLAPCFDAYDVLLLSGGVSMGKLDFLDPVLQQLSVKRLFHKVQQRPGKPFWFGAHPGGTLVFAFPGNPVSAFMCLHRYFLPWLKQVSHWPLTSGMHAILEEEIIFKPGLTYFLPVRLRWNTQGHLLATPVPGNGSGDFSSLAGADAFMELPAEPEIFSQGAAFPVWPFNSLASGI